MLKAETVAAATVDLPLTYKDAVKLHRAGRLLEAKTAYEKLVDQNPRNGDAWFGRATVAAQMGASYDAIIFFEHAMKVMGEKPAIHHNIAAAKSAVGRMAEAEVHYAEAIRLKPDYYEAYFNYANVRTFKDGAAIAAKIEEHLKTPDLTDADRCFLHFAAGKIHDDMREPDKAFPHYVQGNKAKNVTFDPAPVRKEFASIAHNFNTDLLRRLKDQGSDDERVVLVVGMPRSGTTLVEQIIASHPEARGAGELSALNQTVRNMGPAMGSETPYPAYAPELTSDVLKRAGEAYATHLAQRVGDPTGQMKRIVDKTPLNFRHLGLAHLMLPKIKIVHCRRDPLDTCLSCFFQNFRDGQQAYSFSLEHLGLYYGQYVKLMDHWRAAGVPIHDVVYADFVDTIETGAKALLDFIGLDWDPAVLKFHESKRDVQTASRTQVRQPIYKTSVNRSAPYKKHLGTLKTALVREGVDI